MESVTGRVIRIAGNTYRVRTADAVLECKFRGRLKKERQAVVKLAAVGDEVEVVPSGAGEGAIQKVLPRRSKLSRADPGNFRREQVIVANVESLIIVQAARRPSLDLLVLDKCTVMAAAAGIPAAVCVNKSDLGPAPAADLYAKLGMPLFRTSAALREGLEPLAAHLAGRISVFLGPSGVGKSSLIRALHPHLALKVGEVRTKTGEGRHTTTWVELFDVGSGTFVADTPGLEYFTVWEVTPGNLREHFPEFEEAAPACKFRDCTHVMEPRCAVREAVQQGRIASSRHENYLRILSLLKDRQAMFDSL
ncbi:MAG: ribosome small subunit-dependent GTPase A [Planctomycetes bacterium]|nr:ribosome small subunit-dependent GTPase A [Planctomycetota bacterium]